MHFFSGRIITGLEPFFNERAILISASSWKPYCIDLISPLPTLVVYPCFKRQYYNQRNYPCLCLWSHQELSSTQRKYLVGNQCQGNRLKCKKSLVVLPPSTSPKWDSAARQGNQNAWISSPQVLLGIPPSILQEKFWEWWSALKMQGDQVDAPIGFVLVSTERRTWNSLT